LTCTSVPNDKLIKLTFDKYSTRRDRDKDRSIKRKVCNSQIRKMEEDNMFHVYYSLANADNDKKNNKKKEEE
jgi:hypothetical protein